jgi:cobalamin-dependent methionine synthase I
MTDTTDDMRAELNYEAEAYRLRGRMAELEARVLELEVDNDGLRAEMAREVEVNASGRETRGRLEAENAKLCERYLARVFELAADNGRLRAEIARRTEILARVETWTLEMGASLIPPRADTYGEGMRDAKGQVGRLLRGRT